MSFFLSFAFLCFLFLSGNSQTFYFEPFYQFPWNQGTASVDFTFQGDQSATIDCSLTPQSAPISRFFLERETFPYEDAPENQTISIPITWTQSGSSPGGFADITCQVQGNDDVTGIAKVQLLFPPAVAIYPETLYLPRDNGDNETFYSFEVALTEVPLENLVVIVCTRTRNTDPNPLNIVFRNRNATGGDTRQTVNFQANYDINSDDVINAIEEFTCRASSTNNGNQYLKETSVSNAATFRVNPQGQISIRPARQTISGRSATVFLELDQVQGVDVIFKCFILNALPDNAPTDSTECKKLSTNDTWEDPGLIEVPQRAKSSRVRVQKKRSVEITQIENVFVYCCGSDGPTSGLTAFASINLNYSPQQVGLSSPQILNRTPFDDPKWVNPARCQCDLLANDCDVNCCCDPDCSSQSIAVFDCLPGSSTDSDEDVDKKDCKKSEDTNPFFCVHKRSTNWLGYYYPNVLPVSSDSDSRFDRDEGYKTGNPQVQPPPDSGYQKGKNIATTLGEQRIFMPFPQQLIPGMCFFKSHIQFLEERSTNCPIVATRTNCETPTSPLNARNYLMSPDRTYPRPLNYYDFPNITSTFRCPNSAGGGFESDFCWFNEQEGVLPPEPVFNSGICSNVVLEVTYNFKWRGNSVVGVESSFILGKIPVSDETGTAPTVESFGFVEDRGNKDPGTSVEPPETSLIGSVDYNEASVATTGPSPGTAQKFTVSFTYEPEIVSLATEKRSGNPGYITGLPILTALGTLTNGSVESLQPSSSVLRFPKATSQRLCERSSSLGINFQTNVTSSCLVQLKYSDFQDCALLQTSILEKLPEFPDNVYIARRGNSQAVNLGDWVPFFKESESDAIWGNYSEFIQNVLGNQSTEDNPERENITDIYRDRKGLCRNMPVGHSIEFLVSDAGMLNGVIQYEIIASRLRTHFKDFEMNCFKVSNPGICDPDSTDTQKFLLTSHVKFFTIPNPANQPRKPKSQLKREERENCETNDICWGNMFYPLRKPPGSDRIKFLLFQENVFFTIVIVIVTLFVWRFSSLWMAKIK